MENVLNSVVVEFKLRMFDESFFRIRKCLNVIGKNDLWRSPNENITSIGSGIQHIIGNSTQWVVATLGEREDTRERSNEFMKNEKTAEELLVELEELELKLKKILNELTDDQLDRIYSVQNFKVSGFSILIHVIEHTSYHTGQITLLTKLYEDKDLGYYSGHVLE